MKKIMINCFLLLLLLPSLLTGISAISDITTDVELGGYVDATNKPSFTLQSFFEGTYQTEFTKWFDNSFSPRGVITKTYNSIQYTLFDEGNNVIGNNSSLYEDYYIFSELCIGDQYNFSILESQTKARAFADTLAEIKEKLAVNGKALLLYITPNKAHHFPEEIPYKYRVQAPENGIRGVDYLIPLLEEYEIPYVYCDNYANDMKYPTFYPTGIHWARTYEQICHNAVIDKATELSGKHYPTIKLGNVISRDTPFWRDTDLFNLLNIWGKYNDIVFYEYEQSEKLVENYDPINLLIQGGSFVDGLDENLLSIYPDSNINYINYNVYYSENGKDTAFKGDWESVPLGKMLDQSDCVIIELNEAAIAVYSSGFAQHLNSYLDEYDPGSTVVSEKITFDITDGISQGSISGVWEDGWGSQLVSANIRNQHVADSGLAVEFTLLQEIFSEKKNVDVSICVNGALLYENTFDKAWNGVVYIAPERIPQNQGDIEDLYTVTILTNATFCPAEVGMNDDTRDLAIWIHSIGEGQ